MFKKNTVNVNKKAVATKKFSLDSLKSMDRDLITMIAVGAGGIVLSSLLRALAESKQKKMFAEDLAKIASEKDDDDDFEEVTVEEPKVVEEVQNDGDDVETIIKDALTEALNDKSVKTEVVEETKVEVKEDVVEADSDPIEVNPEVKAEEVVTPKIDVAKTDEVKADVPTVDEKNAATMVRTSEEATPVAPKTSKKKPINTKSKSKKN